MMIIGCDFHASWQQVSWVDRGMATIRDKMGHLGLRHQISARRQWTEVRARYPATNSFGVSASQRQAVSKRTSPPI
jgi:hypothetical protein